MKNHRKGMTLIEALVIICIVGVLVALLVPACVHVRGWSYQDRTVTGKVIRVYNERTDKHTDRHMVEVRLDNGGVEVFRNEDEWVKDKYNSSTLQAELADGSEENRGYRKGVRFRFTIYGPGRSERWSRFDNIITTTPIDPEKEGR